MYAYIGCRTTKERNARGKGISVYEVNGKEWKLRQVLEGEINPSYLCHNKKGDRIYSIHGDFSEVSAYAAAADGTLTKFGTTGTHGTNPVHLVLSPNEKWLYVANLQTGAVSVIPVLEDGALGTIKELYFISGNGGPGYISHPHQIGMDRSGKWMFVPTQGRLQGIGKVTVYAIDEEQGTLTETFVMKGRTGAEPRHSAMHPNNQWFYLINEKDSTVVYYHFDDTTGELTPQQMISTLPDDYFGDGWASGLVISEDGKNLYASNRKHDSVTVYELDIENGRMTLLQNIKTGGGQPRFITLTPDGTELIAANETSDSLTFFTVNPEDGTLSADRMMDTESPVCVDFVE